MQAHLVSKIIHQNFDIILLQFNYVKNNFIALSPDGQIVLKGPICMLKTSIA